MTVLWCISADIGSVLCVCRLRLSREVVVVRLCSIRTVVVVVRDGVGDGWCRGERRLCFRFGDGRWVGRCGRTGLVGGDDWVGGFGRRLLVEGRLGAPGGLWFG